MTRRIKPDTGVHEESRGTSREELEFLIHELKIHQEELNAQQTQLIESQRALERACDRYEELFDFAPIGYIALDFSGSICEANLAAAALTGADRSALIGRPLFLHVIDSHRRTVLDHVARCRRGERRVETEVTLRHKGTGKLVPVQLTSGLVNHDNRALLLTALVDLTESRRMEKERATSREAETHMRHEGQLARVASDAKDRFLATLSHELRTPLTPILLALDAIQQRGPLDDALQSTLNMIHRNVALETRLIDDLLDVSRIVQGKMSFLPEVVDVHVLVHEVLDMLEGDFSKGEVAANVDLRAEAHHVNIDPVRFRQVLWNVLHNSLRNTPSGGQIALTTTNEVPDRIILRVKDTGRGIEASLLPRIFKFFEQSEEARRRGLGLGLGLPISKAIVDAHDGSMSIASDGNDRGTCVCVELPTVPPQSTAAVTAVPSVRAPRQSRRLLLVEDNKDSASALAELLSMQGYEVSVAGSVHEALGFIDDVDIVISDIGLPDGTGHELMKAILLRRPLKGIALSGYGTSEDMQRSAEAGFEHHIVKPVEPQLLLDALESLSA